MRFRKSMISGLCLLLVGTAAMMGACSSKKDGNINDSDKSINTTTAANEPVAGNEGNQAESGDSENSADITKFDINVSYKDKQLNTVYDETAATKIQLSDSGIQVSDSGAVVQGNTVTITKAGTYIISGSVSDGQVIVDSSEEGYVWLVLDNVSITSQNSSAIYVKSADNTLITLSEGTKNEVTDGKDYVFEEEETSLNAAIYSKDDLFINGTGSLTVTGNYNHGIQSKDDLVIISGNITVHSAGDGIVGKDSVVIREAVITVEAGGDGIKSTNAVQDKGYIYLDNPNITITAANDGIQAETCMVIEDGIYDIITGGGSGNASTKDNGEFNHGWGNWGGGRPGMREDMEPDSNNDTVSDSAKGIKAGVDITINGGVFTCDTSDDAIHSNNSITINKGTMTMASGDDGIHSDTILTIYGGEIEITKSYEGIESANIYVNDGTITLTASDDGINAAGGSDGSAINGRPGQNSFSGAGDYEMVFNGGTVLIYADGDGLDSNGKIIINGGTLWIEGPEDGGNAAVDYETGLEINGGTLFAAGSAGMAEAPTGGRQCSVMINFDSVFQGETKVTVRDSEGTGILDYTPGRSWQSVIFSSPDLQKSNTYDILTNEELYTSVKLSDMVTTIGVSGGMNGGMRNPGGMREHPDNREEGIREFPDGRNRETEGGSKVFPEGERKVSEKIQRKLRQRIFIPAAAVVMAGIIIFCYMPIYGADTESVVTIIKDGQVTDSFCGVAAEYITTQSDTGIYSCAGYVKKFYATVFGVNVYQINSYDGPPLVSMSGHSVSLKQVITPKPGDIMQNKERTHVAVVKQVSGTRATLIEQNYKWTSGGKIYTRVNRAIDCQSAYFYRLVIDGREASVNGKEDYVPETYEIWRVKDASEINVRSGAGASYGTLGTLGNGTIFYVYGKTIAGGFTWGRINYNNTTGYVALEYAEYMSGVITKDSTPPVISDIAVTEINSTGYTVTCKVTDDVKVDRVQFPTWTILNGQDDLCGDWDKNEKVSGTMNGDRVTFRVKISQHNGETGRYATHIYAYDSSGNMSGCMIEPVYTGFENLGDKFYAAISSCQGTYVTNDTQNVTAGILKTAEAESLRQIWKFTRQKDGAYKINSAFDKNALYVKGASGTNGTNIIPYADKPSKGQNWYIYKYNGRYRFGAACSDCCMTLNGGSSADGTNIKMTTVNGASSQTFDIEMIPQKPVITAVEPTDYNKMTIRFSPLNHVHGYKIYRRNGSDGTYRWIATVKSTEASVYTDTHCTPGQEYSYKIRAYTNISSSYQHNSAYSDSVGSVTQLKAAGFTSAAAASDRVSLKWTSVPGATGYEIYRGTDKNGKYYKVKTVTPGTRHSYTDSGLKKGKNYYYKIRVYRKVNGINVYSDYSAPIHAKTR